MEEDQEHKHVCKFCDKSFPCGRSLGGHMRSHMKNTSAKAKEKINKKNTICSSVDGGNNSNSTFMVDFEAGGGHGVYGLRENPKKSWRLSDFSDGNLMQNQVCKECGKGFQSCKALFGHMRCHVERERVSINNSLQEDSWTGENQKLVMDSQSDNEAVAPKRRRRTRRTRYKSTTTTTTSSSSFSLVNASTDNNSEIEQEQEEVAICLMMLSRDVGYWGGLDSVVDSSDNNSVVLEVRSSVITKNIEEIKDFNGEKSTVKMKKPREKKLESSTWESGNAGLKRKISELGGFTFGLKKVESEVSVDVFFGKDDFERHKTDSEAVFKVFDDELGKVSNNEDRIKCTDTEVMKNLIKEADEQGDSVFLEYNSSKKTKYNSEEGKNSPKKIKYDALDSEIGKISSKKSKYECTTCNKVFHSYQALGGHKASHKKIKSCFSSKIESSETSIETEVSPDPTVESKLIKSCSNESPIKREREISCIAKKSKHECPICFKVFPSGQALGGHKRSHLIENAEVRGNQNTVIQQQIPEIHDLLDLNLPAPIEEETKDQIGFNPWWVGSNHNSHEPPVGMISH
ncbi:zinc finger protein [Macleaya cordata]|uniref:Zinc finger protein n=1 Tax=Macleaya cordata TaxID=56857 RepID=A0A200QBU2_MACCD|nr:zinc finger protein [Macleaya cordata]